MKKSKCNSCKLCIRFLNCNFIVSLVYLACCFIIVISLHEAYSYIAACNHFKILVCYQAYLIRNNMDTLLGVLGTMEAFAATILMFHIGRINDLFYGINCYEILLNDRGGCIFRRRVTFKYFLSYGILLVEIVYRKIDFLFVTIIWSGIVLYCMIRSAAVVLNHDTLLIGFKEYIRKMVEKADNCEEETIQDIKNIFSTLINKIDLTGSRELEDMNEILYELSDASYSYMTLKYEIEDIIYPAMELLHNKYKEDDDIIKDVWNNLIKTIIERKGDNDKIGLEMIWEYVLFLQKKNRGCLVNIIEELRGKPYGKEIWIRAMAHELVAISEPAYILRGRTYFALRDIYGVTESCTKEDILLQAAKYINPEEVTEVGKILTTINGDSMNGI